MRNKEEDKDEVKINVKSGLICLILRKIDLINLMTMERAVFPDGFLPSDSSPAVMIAGLNRSVARINNGSKGPRCKIDDDERQQSAMGTRRAQRCALDTQTHYRKRQDSLFTAWAAITSVAARPHHSCHITNQIMYMHSTIIPDSPPSHRPYGLKY